MTKDKIINPLSVFAIREKPVLQSRGAVPLCDPDVIFLQINTRNIIAFYLMIDSIEKSFRLTTTNNMTEVDLSQYPNIFNHFKTANCVDILNKLVKFYTDNYDKLNYKLKANLQKRLA